MSLTIGPATDYLVALANQAVTGVTVNGDPVHVSDGEPRELAFGMFVIGMPEPPPEAAEGETRGSRTRLTMGAYTASEDYDIPCFIDVRIGDATSKQVRDAAESIFNAFWGLFAVDVTLGGALPGGSAQVTNLSEVSGTVGSTGAPGRRLLIMFDVHCTAVIQ